MDDLICANCGELIKEEDQSHSVRTSLSSTATYCEDCRDNGGAECLGCGEDWILEAVRECEECFEYYCPNCYNNHLNLAHDREGAREISFTRGRRVSTMPFRDFVGVELECFGELGFEIEENWLEVDDDSSISADIGDSYEFKLHPSSGDALVDRVELVTEKLLDSGFKVNASCGLHVHIDFRDLKNKPVKLSRSMLTFYAFEDILFSMLPNSRWNSSYCLPLFKNHNDKTIKARKLEKLGQGWYKNKSWLSRTTSRWDGSRYNGINLHSVFHRGSLEIRLHSGTLDSEKILNWIYILLAIKNWADKDYDSEVIGKAITMKTNKKKLELFFDTFALRPSLRKYINKRIAKFNPDTLSYNKKNYWDVKKDQEKTTKRLNNLRNLYNNYRSSLWTRLVEQLKKDPESIKPEYRSEIFNVITRAGYMNDARRFIEEKEMKNNLYLKSLAGKQQKTTLRLQQLNTEVNEKLGKVAGEEVAF